MGEYSIYVDWSKAFTYDGEGWEPTTRQTLESEREEVSDDNDEGFNEDVGYPMMNYAYPLYKTPSTEQILKVFDNTNCVVVYNNEDDMHYLALAGGGMDLSQDIAYAYILCGEFIPSALAMQVCTQEGLSVGGKNWVRVMWECKKSLRFERNNCISQITRINDCLKGYREKKEG